MVSQEQIKSLVLRKDELSKFIDIEGKQIEANALETKSQQNEFWNKPKEAQILLKKLNTLKSWLNSYKSVLHHIQHSTYMLQT